MMQMNMRMKGIYQEILWNSLNCIRNMRQKYKICSEKIDV
jgi:hypothetical protein